jgi:hypothetical protein
MSQVTIYLEEETLALAKVAAARAKMSLSKWFAQFAEAEKTKPLRSWDEVYAEIDRLRDPESDKALDFLLDPKSRYEGLLPQREVDWGQI